MHRIVYSDNLAALGEIEDESIGLIYIDPPFNTGRKKVSARIKSVRTEDGAGDRVGFQGRSYRTLKDEGAQAMSYADAFRNREEFQAFLTPRLIEARRVLAPQGSLYFHIDQREVHYCKVLLDQIFGEDAFINEVIWAYDYGGRGRDRWPAKHDNILVYAKTPGKHVFNFDEIERIPYMAPGLVTKEKAERGKLPTDTWWHTIVPTTGTERTGYPTQKPLGVLRRIVQASSKPGDVVLDFFAGSGTTGAACLELGRRFVLIDSNIESMRVMAKRFAASENIEWQGFSEALSPEQPASPAKKRSAKKAVKKVAKKAARKVAKKATSKRAKKSVRKKAEAAPKKKRSRVASAT